MLIEGPEERPKPYHRANELSSSGEVSALCFKQPRAIDLSKSLWTIRDEAVTCPKCLKLIGEPA